VKYIVKIVPEGTSEAVVTISTNENAIILPACKEYFQTTNGEITVAD
jgi:hypothetical protein